MTNCLTKFALLSIYNQQILVKRYNQLYGHKFMTICETYNQLLNQLVFI